MEFFAALGAGAGASGAAAAGASTAAGAATAGAATAAAGTAASGTFLGLSAAQLAGIGTGLSALAAIGQGQAAKEQADFAADQEAFAAREREVSRKRRLIASLATQNAVRGAQGIRMGEGSPSNLALSDIETAASNQLADTGSTATRINVMKAGGRAERTFGLMSAGSSLLEFGRRRAERG